MNLLPSLFHLREYAAPAEWRHATRELCDSVLARILERPPTEESWLALQELMGAWPDPAAVEEWVDRVEPRVDRWPWRSRQSILGQPHTRGEKSCVYRLVGYLHITDVEDAGGYKLRRWSRNKHWENLKGVGLFKVETEAEHLAAFLASPYLRGLCSLQLKALDPLSGQLGVMFGASELPDLKELELISLGLKVDDLLDLAATRVGAQLRVLHCTHNYLYERDEKVIADAFPRLDRLVVAR